MRTILSVSDITAICLQSPLFVGRVRTSESLLVCYLYSMPGVIGSRKDLRYRCLF
jgi:hypothetical protein